MTGAAVANQFPPSAPFTGQIEVEGAQSSTSGATLPTAGTSLVSRGYFQTLHIPMLAGRMFDERDRPGTQRTAVVNSTFVNRFLAGRPAIGARLRLAGRDGSNPWSEIIGIVADARNSGMSAPVRPEVFLPMESGRDAWNQLFLLVRSHRPAAALLPDVRRAVAAIDPQQPVYAIQTLEEAMAVSTFQQRISAVLLGTFAGVALLLAAIGIYGVMSYMVSARTQEMGVRLAVGAPRGAVMWLVLKQVLVLSLTGLTIGVGLLLAASRSIEGLLFGVRATDPLTMAMTTAVLGAVSLCAAWAPAARASRVDPVVALRYE